MQIIHPLRIEPASEILVKLTVELSSNHDSSDLLLGESVSTPRDERILVKKVYFSNGSLQETVVYVDENFVRVTNSSGSFDYTYVKHEGQLVAQQNPDGTKMFVLE